jgi:hypothetical protein
MVALAYGDLSFNFKVKHRIVITIKKFTLLIGFLTPFFAYLIFITIRDPRFVLNSLRGPDSTNSEFFGVSQFCVDIPRCFRVSSSYTGEIINIFTNFLLSINLNFFNPHYPISIDDYNAFLNILSGFTFRTLIFLGIIYLLHLLFNDVKTVILLSSLSFLFLSHYFHIFILESIFGNIFQLPEVYMVVLRNIILMYLVYYDYTNLFISLTIVLIITRLNTSKRKYPPVYFFLLGITLTSFFEHLGILLVLSLLFQSFQKNLVKALTTFLGSLTYLLIFLFFVNLNQPPSLSKSRSLISTYLFYFDNNIQNINLAYVQLFLMLFFPAIIGITISYLISKSKFNILIDENVLNSFKSVILAYLCIYFFGFLSSGIAGEFTRQAIPFAFLTIIYFSVKKFPSNSKI